ncbi:MAG TPA: class I SAM-dependent methyltransferase [Thermoplasmata archaeon]|nr:class I SAM-dependent methyltransferase [Thermoplasmata archaeon]
MEANPVERCSRLISIALLRDRLADCHRLLEIGPGVGIETIPLLRDGHAITAVDIAPAMLRNLTERARAAGVVENLRTVRLSAGELDQLGTGEGATRFDGAYSTFGALNCEPNLAPVARQAARLLPPGAPFILGVFNRMNITELLMSLMSLNRRRAINRGDLFVKVGQSRFAVDYVPRSVSEVRATFSPDFRFERVQGFPVLLPPPDRVARWRRLLENVPALLELDGRMGRSQWFAPVAEHLWITLVRSG